MMQLSQPSKLTLTETTPQIFDYLGTEFRQRWQQQGIYQSLDIFSAFQEKRNLHPEKIAIYDQDAQLSFTELHAKALALAQYLQQHGIHAGDVVAVNLANSWRSCAVDLACAALGAIVMPYPLGRRAHETRQILRNSGAKILICQRYLGQTDYAGLIDQLRTDLPALARIVVHGPAYADWDKLDSAWSSPAYAWCPAQVNANQAARIMVSSGTESQAKLIVYSHNSLLGGQARYLQDLGSAPEQIRALFCVSLASPFGSLGSSCLLAGYGASLVNLERYQAEHVLELSQKFAVSHIFAGPNIVDDLLQCTSLAPTPSANLPQLTAIISGGSALSHSTAERVRQHFDCALIQSYGSADGVACHTGLTDSPAEIVDSVGIPDPAVVSIRIVNQQGTDQMPGESGEIWARGPMTPMCYLAPAELNSSKRSVDGWVKTGDLGYLDQDGRLHVQGRNNDVLLRNGIKLNPGELEQLVQQHPAIASVQIINLGDQQQARIHACLVLRGDMPAPEFTELGRYLSQYLGIEAYKLPDSISYHASFPLAASGKVDRQKLWQMLSQNQAIELPQKNPAIALNAESLLSLLTGVERAGIVRAAIELGIFDALAATELSAADLARQVRASERGTRILANALAGLGLLQQTGQNYALNSLSRHYLLSQGQHYVGGLAKVYTADLMWDTFRTFKSAVVAGHSVLDQSLEIANHPYWQDYSAGIHNTSINTARRLVELTHDCLADLPQAAILDLGCSSGIYGLSLLQAHPQAKLTGLDWPASAAAFQNLATSWNLSDRSHFISGDLFELNLPAEYDLVILSQILHHFDQCQCLEILRRASKAIAPGGKLVLCDFMLAEQHADAETMQRIFATQMLGLTQAGDCYSLTQFIAWLQEAGYSSVQSHKLRGLPVHCLIAQKG